jgi:hypothetical protein
MPSLLACFCITAAGVPASPDNAPPRSSIRNSIDAVIPALMLKDRIPGMAVAVTDNGKTVVINYGVASINPRIPVTDDTLFELGSISKTFIARRALQEVIDQHAASFVDGSFEGEPHQERLLARHACAAARSLKRPASRTSLTRAGAA